MTTLDLQTCYAQMGGDYAAVTGRLRSEERVIKFLGLFLADETYAQLTDALGKEDWATAFRAAHSLKGVALNLALTALATSSSELTECLRPGVPTQEPGPLYEKVRADYERTVSAITQLRQG